VFCSAEAKVRLRKGAAVFAGLSRLHTSALPEADDSAFGVLEVGREAHVNDWFLLPDGLTIHLAARRIGAH